MKSIDTLSPPVKDTNPTQLETAISEMAEGIKNSIVDGIKAAFYESSTPNTEEKGIENSSEDVEGEEKNE